MGIEFANVFHEIAAILAVTVVLGMVAKAFKQPLIIAYIAAGLLVGPAVFGWQSAVGQVELFASIGIAVLLFVVGLKLDIRLISSVGPVALATGLGQIGLTAVTGFVIAMALGLEAVPAAYVAAALTISSTIVIVKLLSDKREIDSLHGRIAVGILIVQDIVTIIALVVLSAFSGTDGSGIGGELLRVLVTGAGFVIVLVLLMRFVIPQMLERVARSQELLITFAIAWAITLAALGDGLGFSKEVGAFLAGVSLASTRFREAIASRLVTLRDFLLIFFFINLGTKLDVGSIGEQIVPAIVLSLFVLIGNPIIVLAIMGFMGYRRRTGLLTGLTVAQISEFSLILAALGVTIGHIGSETLSLITVVGIATIGLSTYLILYSHQLYEWLERPLRIFERSMPLREIAAEEGDAGPARVDAVVFGLGRYGFNISLGLAARGMQVLGVDFDPAAVRAARKEGIATQYGDAEDPELLGYLPVHSAQWVISTVRVLEANLMLLRALQHHGYTGKVAVTSHSPEETERLTQAGADIVLIPYADAADQAVDLIAGPGEPARARASRETGTLEGAFPLE